VPNGTEKEKEDAKGQTTLEGSQGIKEEEGAWEPFSGEERHSKGSLCCTQRNRRGKLKIEGEGGVKAVKLPHARGPLRRKGREECKTAEGHQERKGDGTKMREKHRRSRVGQSSEMRPQGGGWASLGKKCWERKTERVARYMGE